MKIKIVSDLHLEFSTIDIYNNGQCDVLILAGDIMLAEDLHNHKQTIEEIESDPRAFRKLGHRQRNAYNFRKFLTSCSERFPHVIYIAGNHEFYHSKFFAGIDYLREECSNYHNVHFLERDSVVIDDVVFVGGTLWTDLNRCDNITIDEISTIMYDYSAIRNDRRSYGKIQPIDTVGRHEQTLKFFDTELEKYKDRKCVVVSHHTPSFNSCHPKYATQHHMNGGFHSNLEKFIEDRPQIVLWAHGHTHDCFDYYISNTRVICNPRGYETSSYKEHSGWDPKMSIEI